MTTIDWPNVVLQLVFCFASLVAWFAMYEQKADRVLRFMALVSAVAWWWAAVFTLGDLWPELPL